MLVVPLLGHGDGELVVSRDFPDLNRKLDPRPTVEMDAHALLLERSRVSVDPVGCDPALWAVDMGHPVAVMLGSRGLRAPFMVGHNVLKRRGIPVLVDPATSVGQGEQQDAAGAQNPQMGFKGADWVLAVLEKVRRDDEVLALIAYLGKSLAVIDQID